VSVGSGASASVIVSITGQVGTFAQTFTYNAPVLTEVRRANVAQSAGASISVLGMNFATYDPTPSMQLGLTACLTVGWS